MLTGSGNSRSGKDAGSQTMPTRVSMPSLAAGNSLGWLGGPAASRLVLATASSGQPTGSCLALQPQLPRLRRLVQRKIRMAPLTSSVMLLLPLRRWAIFNLISLDRWDLATVFVVTALPVSTLV